MSEEKSRFHIKHVKDEQFHDYASIHREIQSLESRLDQLTPEEKEAFLQTCQESYSDVGAIMCVWAASQSGHENANEAMQNIRGHVKQVCKEGRLFGYANESKRSKSKAGKGLLEKPLMGEDEEQDRTKSIVEENGEWVQDLIAKFFAEFIGTFFLALAISLSPRAGLYGPFVVGFALLTMVYAQAHVSGSHFNPAVTLAVSLLGDLSVLEGLVYVVAQVLGTLLAGSFGASLIPSIGYPTLNDDRFSEGTGMLLELILTAFLVFNILSVAVPPSQSRNSYFGLVIGTTVLSGAIASGDITGGCFNPAIAFLTLAHGTEDEVSHAWIYFIGPLLGGLVGHLLFRFVHATDIEERQKTLSNRLGEFFPKYLNETVCVAFLCFMISMTGGRQPLAPFAIGFSLANMIFGTAYVSGAHFNPAVTFAMILRPLSIFGSGQTLISYADAAIYIVCQLVGAIIGGSLGIAVLGTSHDDVGYPHVGDHFEDMTGMNAELLATCALVYVVLNLGTSTKTAGHQFVGMIGIVVLWCAFAFGFLSGAALNPAVGLILPILNNDADDIWIYLLGPLLGSLIAFLLFRLTNPNEFKKKV